MHNFKPGGIRHRKDDIGGRPRSDADYGTKKRFDKGGRNDDRGGSRHGGGDRGGRFDNNNGPKRDVELFDATCTTCNKPCQVPFRPDGTKPVLCRDCFATKNASPAAGGFERLDGNNFQKRDDRKPEWSNDRKPEWNNDRKFEAKPHNSGADVSGLTKQVASLEAKLNEAISLIKSLQTTHTPVAAPKAEKQEVVVAKKEVKPVAKVAAKKAVAKVVKEVKVVAKKVVKAVKPEAKKVEKKVVAKKAAPKVAKKAAAKKTK